MNLVLTKTFRQHDLIAHDKFFSDLDISIILRWFQGATSAATADAATPAVASSTVENINANLGSMSLQTDASRSF